MPALICTVSGVSVFLTDVGNWLVRRYEHEADAAALKERSTLLWLPLLEQDYLGFRQQVVAALELLGANVPAIFASFPFHDLLLLGLKSQSSYWIERAVDWASHVTVDAEVKQLLLAVSVDKHISQQVRHQAKSIFFAGKVE